MLRTHTCGQLSESNIGEEVTLSGWVAKVRHLGSMGFIDLRDKFGITQLSFNEEIDANLLAKVKDIGREYVLQATGKVVERSNKNPNIPTGNIEIIVTKLTVLNASETPPFTIEDETDGGEEIRMKYRYLDIRRNPVLNSLKLRSKASQSVREFLNSADFMEIETPVLIKSTPEGARDFVVPSRMNQGQFYALPQSPQTFKQLLMIGGVDRYYQIVKCFRDEDLRADRQPEFTQIDCEMSFIERDDILEVFEKMICKLWEDVKGITLPKPFPRMSYDDSMRDYGNDKPDMRFGMCLKYITEQAQGKNFGIFDNAESVLAINVENGNTFTRKQLDKLTDFVKREQIGAKGMIWCRHNADGTFKSSADKFFDQDSLGEWAKVCDSKPNDLMLVMSGELEKTQKQMSELRLEVSKQMDLCKKDDFKPVWILDFPLLELDEETGNYHAMHHPFTSPIAADMEKLVSNPKEVKANAYDLAMNGVELGGGSIRIFDETVQKQMFKALGMSEEESREKFGFLLDAFKYGAPPHGGIAFGFDRLCSMLGGSDSIRDYIAFPKNNQGRDVMIDAPSAIDDVQRKELGL